MLLSSKIGCKVTYSSTMKDAFSVFLCQISVFCETKEWQGWIIFATKTTNITNVIRIII